MEDADLNVDSGKADVYTTYCSDVETMTHHYRLQPEITIGSDLYITVAFDGNNIWDCTDVNS